MGRIMIAAFGADVDASLIERIICEYEDSCGEQPGGSGLALVGFNPHRVVRGPAQGVMHVIGRVADHGFDSLIHAEQAHN